jgi:hypothetical protein
MITAYVSKAVLPPEIVDFVRFQQEILMPLGIEIFDIRANKLLFEILTISKGGEIDEGDDWKHGILTT